MKKFFAKHLVLIVIVVVAAISIVGAMWYINSNQPPSFSTTAATLGNVIASVDEPATVAADNDTSLSFQEGGEIAHVYVAEGQTVSAGTVLADLDTASLNASVQQAQASLDAAQANLDQLQSGTRPEQLTIDQTAVTNAETAVSVDSGNAYTAADDAIQNQTDNLFSNPQSNDPIFLVPSPNTQAQTNIESERLVMQGVLANWYAALTATSTNASSSNGITISAVADAALQQVQSYLDAIALAVNDATPNSTMTASVLAGYKINVSTARTEVGAAITTLTGAESTFQTAQNNLSLAQAGSTPQAIEAQQAVVAQAQAGLSAAQVALGNASLVAPFPGTVQDLTAQVGQVVSPGAPAMSLVNNSGLKIQAYVSEADVANIKIGDTAQITLDAFGTGTTFPATVTTIDNGETQVNGSPAYLVTLHFINAEPQIKDGMTGNAHIILAEHDNVLTVPSNLVINNGNNYYVTIQTATGTQEEQVQIGLVGSSGTTEITSGLSAGEAITNL